MTEIVVRLHRSGRSGPERKLWAVAACAAFVLTLAHPAAADNDHCRDHPRAAAAGPGIVSATVRDATNGRPVVGAIVEWSFDRHAMTGATDNQGRFALRIPIAHGKDSEQVKVTLKSNAYVADTSTITVCPGEGKPLTFQLLPISRFSVVKGAIVDPATGQGIPNATVSILIDKFPQVGLSATTDNDGKYTIPRVGFSHGLTLHVTTTAPPCIAATTLNLDVDEPVVTENLRLPVVATANLHCPSVFSGAPGPVGGGSLADDSSIQWEIATPNAISFTEANNVWHSGHINDILKTGPNSALVASDSAGVWSVAWSSDTASALPLSTGWDSISMTSLAQGPDGPDHVFAGTFYNGGEDGNLSGDKSGVLWETDTSAAAPLLNWVEQSPCLGNNVSHILVIKEFRRIVLACTNGIFWSPIPSAPAAHDAYDWQAAKAAPGALPASIIPPGGFERLAKGPGWSPPAGGPPTEGTIVAIAWNGTAPRQLIYWGSWSNGQLVLNGALVPQPAGSLFESFGRGDLAACGFDPHVMYAMAADSVTLKGENGPRLAAVWKSRDGGQNWTTVSLPPDGTPPIATGVQGNYNQALAVSRADCNTFALGWSYATFVSFDRQQLSYGIAPPDEW